MWAKTSDRLDDLFHELNETIGHARWQAEEAKAALAPTVEGAAPQEVSNEELQRRLRQCASALRRIGPQA